MAGVVVLCWEENRPWVSALRQKALSVPWVEQPKGDAYKQIPEVEPEVLVVDLTRSPDQGRDIVSDLAASGHLEGVPVVLVSESDAAARGLKSKLDYVVVTRPKALIAAVKEALEKRPSLA